MDIRRYKNAALKMRTGDIIEWQSRGAIGLVIRLFTGSKVNHTSVVLRLDDYRGKNDRRWIVEANPHGVELQLLSRRIAGHKGRAWWIPLDDTHNNKRQAVANYLLSNVGIPYDYPNLFKQAFSRVSVDARRFFCSELADSAYRHAGIYQDQGPARRPGDFMAPGVFCPPIQIV